MAVSVSAEFKPATPAVKNRVNRQPLLSCSGLQSRLPWGVPRRGRKVLPAGRPDPQSALLPFSLRAHRRAFFLAPGPVCSWRRTLLQGLFPKRSHAFWVNCRSLSGWRTEKETR